jgi:hypothetical protein
MVTVAPAVVAAPSSDEDGEVLVDCCRQPDAAAKQPIKTAHCAKTLEAMAAVCHSATCCVSEGEMARIMA